ANCLENELVSLYLKLCPGIRRQIVDALRIKSAYLQTYFAQIAPRLPHRQIRIVEENARENSCSLKYFPRGNIRLAPMNISQQVYLCYRVPFANRAQCRQTCQSVP